MFLVMVSLVFLSLLWLSALDRTLDRSFCATTKMCLKLRFEKKTATFLQIKDLCMLTLILSVTSLHLLVLSLLHLSLQNPRSRRLIEASCL